jgi:hypothetical protein
MEEDSPSQIHNITIFLYSYKTGNNFTVTNGTEGENGASLGDIMRQEEGSTVKHVNWVWPDCLVGDGNSGDDRGAYNVRNDYVYLSFLYRGLTYAAHRFRSDKTSGSTTKTTTQSLTFRFP